MNRCPTCGTLYADDARFCTRDGTKLLGGTPVSAPAVAPGAPAPRATTAPVRGDANAPLTHQNLVGKTLQGHYEIVRKIGEGGMSFVYLANDLATRERYAIKVLSAALSQDANAMARLRREASLGMRLAHPNVCHIVRMGETEDGLVYVVMPFVEGEVLADRTNSRSGITTALAIRSFRRDRREAQRKCGQGKYFCACVSHLLFSLKHSAPRLARLGCPRKRAVRPMGSS